MGFENSMQNTEEVVGGYEKKDSEFRVFLNEQVSLPKEQWSREFRSYVEEKYKESLPKEDEPELSPEEQQTRTYERYLKLLDINQEDLKKKKILDLGCGEEGEFVKKCLDDGITQEIYGLDLDIKSESFENKYKNHFLRGDVGEKFPAKDFDYIAAVGVPLISPSEGYASDDFAEKVINNALEALKENGEIRIYPIMKVPPGSEMPGIEFSRKKWLEILEKLSGNGKIEWKLVPVDITVSGREDNKDVWLDEVLIIKKPSRE